MLVSRPEGSTYFTGFWTLVGGSGAAESVPAQGLAACGPDRFHATSWARYDGERQGSVTRRKQCETDGLNPKREFLERD